MTNIEDFADSPLWCPEQSNCLIWAIGMWIKHGGYITAARSSRWFGGFHLIWQSPIGEKYSYAPKDETYVGLKRALEVWTFKGYIKHHTE